MAKTGRPTLMTDDTLQKLRDGFKMGLNDEEACLYAEISPTTLYTYQKENPDFRSEKEWLKKTPLMKAKSNINRALENESSGRSVETSKWYAERKGKNEFSTRTEQTGKDGKDLVISIVNYSDENNDTV